MLLYINSNTDLLSQITNHSVILRMRNVSDNVVEKIKTHILCSVIFFWGGGCLAVYEIILKAIQSLTGLR